MDPPTSCVLHDAFIFVNAQIVTYEEAVKSWPSGVPPIGELFHDILEQFIREITSVVSNTNLVFRLSQYINKQTNMNYHEDKIYL